MNVLIPILFINAGAACLKGRTNTDSSACFMAVLSVFLVAMYFGGLAGFLMPVTVLCFAVTIVSAVYTLIKTPEVFREYVDLWVLLNNVTCIIFAVIFSIKQPLFYYWDEYSFWGPSAKYVKYYNQFYTYGTCPIGDMRSLPPGNTVLNYLYSFFSKDFADYKLLLSYSFLFFAIFALAASLAARKSGKTAVGVGMYFMLLLSPFTSVFHHYRANYSQVSYAYGTSMVDFNISVIFLGAVALYLAAPDKKWYLLPVMFLVTVKNTSIFFGLLAVAVISCFILFDKDKKMPVKLANIIITLAAPLIVYRGWNIHLSRNAYETLYPEYVLKAEMPAEFAQAKDEQESATENARLSAGQEPTVLSVIVPSLRTDRYNEVLAEMKMLFNTEKLTAYTTDKLLVVLLTVVGLAVVVFADKDKKIPMLLIVSGMAAGCLVYCVTISYFVSFFRDGMVEYPRYMTSYYFAWLYTVILLFAVNCGKKFAVLSQLAVCALLAFNTYFVYNMGLNHTVINSPQAHYSEHLAITQNLADEISVIKPGDRVYLVLPDQDTLGYFTYRHYLMPALCNVDTKNTGIDFTITFREEIDWTSDRTYYNVASPQLLAQVMRDYFDYVLVVNPDEEFVQSYSGLFSDGMTLGTLYTITDGEIPMQAVDYENY